jgi:excinuclease ABC subunit B
MFKLESSYQPSGDQPKAIAEIQQAFSLGKKKVTLLGATGTGKTFTMANIIQDIGKPTLVISHNKTLAAQLATEFKHFFPNNAVHYFVSYFDYYQPESYLPAQGLYIEKEATINQEIEMYRLGAMSSLLSREDVIIVASVSSLYGLGKKDNFKNSTIYLETNKTYERNDIKRQLLKIQYKPIQGKIEHGMFDIQGERIDIFSSTEKDLYRLHFNEDILEFIEIRDAVTFEYKGKRDHIRIWPATQFLQDTSDLENILQAMDQEKETRVKEFQDAKMPIEAERIKKRVEYDIRMMRET